MSTPMPGPNNSAPNQNPYTTGAPAPNNDQRPTASIAPWQVSLTDNLLQNPLNIKDMQQKSEKIKKFYQWLKAGNWPDIRNIYDAELKNLIKKTIFS